MKELINRFQNPTTDFGKILRNGIFVAIGAGAIAFLQSLDTIDFGEYEALTTIVIAMLVDFINRLTREK